MKFLYGPEQGTWVATPHADLEARTVARKILSADVCISDLDDTDADSPAKEIAFKALGTSYLSPRYLGWLAATAFQYLGHGKAAESAAWRDYIDTFLHNNPQGLREVVDHFTPERVEATLHPGVKELYGHLAATRVYFTRNIPPVAKLFEQAAGVSCHAAEVFHKAQAIEKFNHNFPHFQRYFVKGDSTEDQEMVEVLQFLVKMNRIESVVSCRRLDLATDITGPWDIGVPKDYRGLVALL